MIFCELQAPKRQIQNFNRTKLVREIERLDLKNQKRITNRKKTLFINGDYRCEQCSLNEGQHKGIEIERVREWQRIQR